MNAMKNLSDESVNSCSVSYQLTHSVVKPFKPKIESFIDLSGTAIKKHVCHQCLDTFIFESSLKYHFERRSIKISYFCDNCKLRLNFYNRCALLSHIRSHNRNDISNEKLEVSQVFVSPLPLTQLLPEGIATYHTFKYNNNNLNSNHTKDQNNCINNNNAIDSAKSESNSTINSNNNISKDKVNSYSLEREENNTNTIIENNKTVDNSNDLIKRKFIIKKSSNCELKCSECNTSLSSVSIREKHFTENNEMALPSNQCKICPIICVTKCSQTVHNRLHFNNNNLKVCPECGAKSNELKDTDFITHIIINCLHFSRRLVYDCIFCSNRMSSLSAFIQHIKSLHTLQFFQCSQCLFKFETDLQLKEHQTNSHPNDLRRIVIFKCPICDTELKSNNTYLEHISNHQKKLFGFAKFLFVCHECNQTFVDKNDLKIHSDSNHTHNKNELEKKEFFTKLTKEISVQFRINVGNDCESYANHKLNNQLNKEKRNVNDLKDDGIETNGRPLKRQMNEKESAVNDNSQTTINTDVKNDETSAKKTSNPKSFKCKECGLTFAVIQTLKRHLILEHRIHDVETYINKINVEIPVVIPEPQLPKEVGEKILSEILSEVRDNDMSSESKCPICSLKFSDSKELRIHGRVHGMAFIKSCQKKNT